MAQRILVDSLPLLSRLILILLLALLGWQSGRVLMLWLQPVTPPLLPALAPQGTAQRAPDLAAALWPRAAHTPQKVLKGTQTDAQTLGITLLGVIALSNGQGVVVVQTSTGRKVVRQSEAVTDGLTLAQVWPDRVVLQRDNGRVLWIPLQQPAAMVADSKPAEQAPPALNTLLQRVRRNPAVLFDYVQLQPGGRNGMQWVTVQPRPGQEALLQALGLKAGDQIEAINGTPLARVARQPTRWQALMNASHWQLTVRRHGQQQEITIDAAQ